jgi:hypothetical protein
LTLLLFVGVARGLYHLGANYNHLTQYVGIPLGVTAILFLSCMCLVSFFMACKGR